MLSKRCLCSKVRLSPNLVGLKGWLSGPDPSSVVAKGIVFTANDSECKCSWHDRSLIGHSGDSLE